ncbi:molybdenum cofactor sulfurase-like [Saccoglossus kowalevskii]
MPCTATGMSNQFNHPVQLLAGHVCGDNFDLVDGLPTGSVRISFGYMSTYQDIKTFLDFIVECFVVEACQNVPHQSHYESTISHHSSQIIKQTLVTMATINKKEELSRREFDHPVPGRNEKLMSSANDVIEGTQVIDNKQCKRKLRGIFLYPVKSCGAMEVTNWPVSACGLLFDRTWMIVNQNGVFLSQKRVIRLCLIKPRVDLEEQQLILHADGFDDIMVPLYAHCHQNTKDLSACRSKVCGDRSV